MAGNIFSDKPFFIPKVDNTKVLEVGLELPYVLVDARTTKWRPGVVPALKEAVPNVLINPDTDRLYNENAKTEGFKELPYNIDASELDKLYSDPTFRLDRLVKPCVAYQNELGAAAIIAPYVFFDDYRSQFFSTNLSMLIDTARNMQANSIELPLLAVINTSTQLINNLESVAYVRSRYEEELDDIVDGYIIAIDDLDDRKEDVNVLIGLARLVHELSFKKQVVVMRIGGFGEVLVALGAAGYSSGTMSGEVFSRANFDETDTPRRGRGQNWFYVPELYNYFDETDLKKASYNCDCPVCNNTVPTSFETKKKHHVQVKWNRAQSHNGTDRTARLNKAESQLIAAKELAGVFKAQHLITPTPNAYYIDKWLDVLKAAKEWGDPVKEDEELEQLLAEIDK